MKKYIFILLILYNGIVGFAQKKSADKVDLDNIKRFYSRLKDNGINTKEKLIWEYTYSDTSETRLKTLAKAFEVENLKIAAIQKSKKLNRYELRVSEYEKYSPESLNDRLHALNKIASENNIMYSDASFGAEKPKSEKEIDSYKKVK